MQRLLIGTLLFLTLGVLFFFVVLGVEYFLWLNSAGRLLLLVFFVAVELWLIYRYILTPIFYLFRIKKGLSNKEASLIVGRHFTVIDDKLFNLFELAENSEESELLAASITQRSESMQTIPFSNAVDFKESLKYLKYVAIPVVLFGLVWISGNLNTFLGSSKRIVNYDLVYEPPAPFRFKLLSNNLKVLNDKPYTIEVMTEGDVRPEEVFIDIAGKRLQLRQIGNTYRYTFTPPLKSTDFFFTANEVRSKHYHLVANEVPAIENFQMVLEYPAYIGRKLDILESTGNATFPEGTKVSWKIRGSNTDEINLITADTTMAFQKKNNSFEFTKRVYADYRYELSTSNHSVVDYERLGYRFEVVKDAYPSIRVEQILDSINPNVSYFIGEVADDYGVREISLVYYPENDLVRAKELKLERPNSNFGQFYYTFPSGLDLKPVTNYSFYFKVLDNDAVHKGKMARSRVFSSIMLNSRELKSRALESQQNIIKGMDKSLQQFKEQKKSLKDINRSQKEKNALSFNDQRQIKDFLQKQKHQENMMQKFSKQLKESLKKTERQDKQSELLQERLERQEIEAEKNEKLLDQLNKIAEKIDKEELTKRLEELGKKQQNSERGLEQLVELTKRYYVTEKMAQLANELEKLSKEQDILSRKELEEGKSEKNQGKLNADFDNVLEELKELKKDNQDLKKPLKINSNEKMEGAIQKDQKEALEEINKSISGPSADSNNKKESSSKAKMKQKSAAQKMKEMSEQLQKSAASGGGGSSVSEDAEMLRQVLDNLITFSFKQENLFESLEGEDRDLPQFSESIGKQRELRGLFEHVDDSLFALSLRRVELSEFVNEQITEVFYNTDKALESIADNKIYQAVSYQKYSLNATNKLSDFLANILDNMQEAMQSGEGEGEGQGFQLPDIIKSQDELQKKMEGKGSSGEKKSDQGKGEKGQGQKGAKGKQPGSDGQEGDSGKGKNGKRKEKGNGEGSVGKKAGEGGHGVQNGPSEEELKEIYEIYKEQQTIRKRLEEQLEDMIDLQDRRLGQKLMQQMEDFENDLLENGITQQGLNKMSAIQYELLKLKDATIKKGRKEERESNTYSNNFKNAIRTKPAQLENYRNEIEILNRQALPLQKNFKNRVKEYFKGND